MCALTSKKSNHIRERNTKKVKTEKNISLLHKGYAVYSKNKMCRMDQVCYWIKFAQWIRFTQRIRCVEWIRFAIGSNLHKGTSLPDESVYLTDQVCPMDHAWSKYQPHR